MCCANTQLLCRPSRVPKLVNRATSATIVTLLTKGGHGFFFS